MPSGTGVAGWVLTTRQPLVINDTAKDSRFARTRRSAPATCPRASCARPLLHGDGYSG